MTRLRLVFLLPFVGSLLSVPLVAGAVSAPGMDIRTLSRQVENDERAVAKLQSEIESARGRSNRLQARLEQARTASNELARRLYQAGPAPLLFPLLSAPSSEKPMRLLAFSKMVTEEREEVLVSLRHLEEQLSERRAELARIRAELISRERRLRQRGQLEGAGTAMRRLYERAAATCPGLPWEVLAAIAETESRHGQDERVSPAGALGPMQFLPLTWGAYGLDANRDGQANIRDPEDAVYGAARLLCANGGGDPRSLERAIFRYNPSPEYVERILALTARYG